MPLYNPNLTHQIAGNTAGATANIATGTYQLAGGNNITLSQNANSVTISAGAGGGGGGFASAGLSNIGNTSGNTGLVSNQLVLAGGNNVTLSGSTNGGSATVTVSTPTQTNQTANFYVSSNSTQLSSTAGIDLRSVTFQGAGIASVGVSEGKVLVSVPSGGGGGDGGIFGGVSNLGNTAGSTGTVSTGNFVLVGSGPVSLSQSTGGAGSAATITINAPATSSLSATGQVSLSTNGSTISIGVPSLITYSKSIVGQGWGRNSFTSSNYPQNTLMFSPHHQLEYLSAVAVKVPVGITNSSSAASSGRRGVTAQFGIYTRNSTNATVLTQHYSTSYTLQASYSSNASWGLSMITGLGNSTSYNSVTASSAGVNLSASLHGVRELIMPISSVMTPGEYWYAILYSSSSSGTVGNVLGISPFMERISTFNRLGLSTGATQPGVFRDIGRGYYTATTSALPGAVSLTQISQAVDAPYYYIVDATS